MPVCLGLWESCPRVLALPSSHSPAPDSQTASRRSWGGKAGSSVGSPVGANSFQPVVGMFLAVLRLASFTPTPPHTHVTCSYGGWVSVCRSLPVRLPHLSQLIGFCLCPLGRTLFLP